MNAGNRKKAWIKYLLSLDILETKDNGVSKAELRKDSNTGACAIVVFLNGAFEESFSENIYTRQTILEMWKNWLEE